MYCLLFIGEPKFLCSRSTVQLTEKSMCIRNFMCDVSLPEQAQRKAQFLMLFSGILFYARCVQTYMIARMMYKGGSFDHHSE